MIVQSVRRSLRGTAADVVRTLSEDITADTVIDKLTRIFGNILPPETLLEQFYSAKQGESEKVARSPGWAVKTLLHWSQLRRLTGKSMSPLSLMLIMPPGMSPQDSLHIF